jgi:hypothetical protein
VDALDVAKVCLRRWFVVVPIMLLAVGAGFSLRTHREASYSGTAAFAFLYTQTDLIKPNQPDPREKNPLLANGGSGTILQDAVIADLTAPTTESQLASPGLTQQSAGESFNNGPVLTTGTAYSVAPQTSASSIIITASGPSPQAVIGTLNRVLAAAPVSAATVQTRFGAPKTSQMTAVTTATPQVVLVPPPSGLKLMIAIVGVGALAAAGAALFTDRILTRRRKHRAKQGAQRIAMLDFLSDLDTRYERPLIFSEPFPKDMPGEPELATTAPTEDEPAGEAPTGDGVVATTEAAGDGEVAEAADADVPEPAAAAQVEGGERSAESPDLAIPEQDDHAHRIDQAGSLATQLFRPSHDEPAADAESDDDSDQASRAPESVSATASL